MHKTTFVTYFATMHANKWSLNKHINIKNCKALLKKVVIGRAVTALKQQNSKWKGQEKGIAVIVHLMKPITRSPDSSSSNNNNSNKSNNNTYRYFLLIFQVPLGTAVARAKQENNNIL
jgi:hypothetical protein